jgi:carboxylesterase
MPQAVPVMAGAEPFDLPGGPVGVLLCHGFTSTPQSMRDWGEHLAAAGFTVRCPLLPGHGTRWQDANASTEDDWYGELSAALDDLRSRCASVVVAGLSMGGTLALRLAERRPDDVAALVLVNPSLLTERRDAKLLPLLAKLTPAWAPIGSDIKKPGSSELAYPRLPTRAAVALRRLWAAVRADLGAVRAPLLVFRSVEDHVVEPASTRLLLAEVGSTDTSEVLLHESWHVATLDHDAPAIFARSVEWIRERVPATAPETP